MALCVLMLTQCRKNVEQVNGIVADGDTMDVTLTASVCGSKTTIEGTDVKWVVGDKLHVVGSANGHLGSLTAVELHDGGNTADFSGQIMKTTANQTYYFYYVGDNDFALDEDYNFTFSVANQYGSLSGDANSVARSLQLIMGSKSITGTPDLNLGTVTLSNMNAIAHLAFTENGIAYSGNVGLSGSIIRLTHNPSTNTFTRTAGPITLNNAGGDYYVSLIPDDDATQTLTFTTETGAEKSLTASVVAGYCYDGGSGAKTIDMQGGVVNQLPGRFSVGDRNAIHFSKGNLYNHYVYDGGNDVYTFRFEEEQYFYRTNPWSETPQCYYIEDGNPITEMEPSYSSSVGIYWWNSNVLKTAATATNSIKYADYGSALPVDGHHLFTNNQTPGVNYLAEPNPDFHIDGETGTNRWRTMSKEEWEHLLARTKQGSTDKLYGLATVNNIKGLILLPDGWTGSLAPSFTYGENGTFGSNVFGESTTPTWAQMEAAGAVFLPAAGRMNPGESKPGPGLIPSKAGKIQEEGNYLTATPSSNSGYVYRMFFNEGTVEVSEGEWALCGSAIRLVRDVK